MKVTIFEYEEDPNHGSSSVSPSSSEQPRETPLHEYTLEFAPSAGPSDRGAVPPPTVLSRRNRRRDAGAFLLRSPRKLLKTLFLPLGYPHSVPDTYLPYQLYDGLQGLCSYWRGVVSARAVFEAAGVGNAEATAPSAALSWALRDGTGMVGGLVYSCVASPYFDSHAREFRWLLADVVNDVALALDLVAPHYGPVGSARILALSTIGKTVCGITAGATKGHITQHFARKGGGNVADLTAKESTQETLVSLLGMAGGVWVAKLLDRCGGDHPLVWTWLFFGVLTAVHVWANYRAVSLLKLATLNPERTRVLFRDSIDAMAEQVQRDWHVAPREGTTGNADQSNGRSMQTSPDVLASISNLQSPERINESMASSIWNLVFPRISVSRSPIWDRLEDCSLYRSGFEHMGEKNFPYVIGYDARAVVFVWLTVGTTMEDELQAYVHALLLSKLLSDKTKIAGNQNCNFDSNLIPRCVFFFWFETSLFRNGHAGTEVVGKYSNSFFLLILNLEHGNKYSCSSEKM